MARHALVLGATAAVIVSLSVGLSMALWQARQARLEAAKATAIKDFMVGLFKANDLDQVDAPQKRQQSVQDLLQDSARALGGGGLSGQPQVRAELQGVVGNLLHDLQLSEAAIALRRQRIELLSRTGAGPETLVPAWRDLADSQDVRDDLAGMRLSLEKAGDLCRRHAMSPLTDCHGAQVLLGTLDLLEHHMSDAQRRIEASALTLQTQAPIDERTAEAIYALGALRDAQGQRSEALALYERSLQLREQLWGDKAPRLAHLRYELGLTLWDTGEYHRADKQFEQAHHILLKAMGEGHPSVASVQLQWSRLRLQMSLDDADWNALSRAADQILKRADGTDPTSVLLALTARVEGALMTGRLNAAQSGLSTLTQALPRLDVPPSRLRNISLLRAWFWHDTGHYDQAIRELSKLIQDAKARPLPIQDEQGLRDRLQVSMVAAGQAYKLTEPSALHPDRSAHARWAWLMAQGRTAEALAITQEPTAAMSQMAASETLALTRFGQQLRKGNALRAEGQCDQALPAYEQAQQQLLGSYVHNVHLAALRLQMAQCLITLGRPQQATALQRQAARAFAAEPLAAPHLKQATPLPAKGAGSAKRRPTN